VDDLFPCEPNGAPLFSSCMNGELWLMILEKAYAKVHGSYFLLKDGFVHEALMDLSGCPTASYNLKDDQVQHFISDGQFWELMKYFKTEGYLLSLSTAGEAVHCLQVKASPSLPSKILAQRVKSSASERLSRSTTGKEIGVKAAQDGHQISCSRYWTIDLSSTTITKQTVHQFIATRISFRMKMSFG
jgi:hypothetical protein